MIFVLQSFEEAEESFLAVTARADLFQLILHLSLLHYARWPESSQAQAQAIACFIIISRHLVILSGSVPVIDGLEFLDGKSDR